MKSFLLLCLVGCLAGCVTPNAPVASASPSATPGSSEAESLITAADALQKDGRVNEARYAYNAALEKFPDNYTMLTNRASCEIFLADYDQAVVDLQKAQAVTDKAGKKKESAAIRLDLAMAYFKQKKFAEAIPVLDAAIPLLTETKQDELEAAAYVYRGTAYNRTKKLDQAVSDLSAAIKIEPNDPNAYAERAEILEQQHKFGPAADDLEKASKSVKDTEVLAALDKRVKALRKKAK